MLQWLFTILGAINKLAQAVLSIAEAVDASAQTLKSAALDSIDDEATKAQLKEQDEFNRFCIQTKSTVKKMEEFRKLKKAEESKPKQ